MQFTDSCGGNSSFVCRVQFSYSSVDGRERKGSIAVEECGPGAVKSSSCMGQSEVTFLCPVAVFQGTK